MKHIFSWSVGILFVLSQIILLSSSHAAEGFSADRNALPENLRSAWDSTFFLESLDQKISGTAFIVKIENQNGTRKVYFLTNRHVIADFGCTKIGPCEGASLFHDLGFTPDLLQSFIVAHPLKVAGIQKGVELVALNTNPDLALLSVVVDQNFSDFTPISLDSCAPTNTKMQSYLMGYSTLWSRTDRNDDSDIERWSVGMSSKFLTQGADAMGVPQRLIPTTNDSIPGGSGGPALNGDGKLIGILQLSGAVEKNHYIYTGREDAGDEYYHSFLIPCEVAKNFAEPYLN